MRYHKYPLEVKRSTIRVVAEIRRAFGAEVRGERARQGMAQWDLARRAGIARSTLSRIEQGVADPTLSDQAAIAGALGLTVDELLRRARGERDGKV